MSRYLKRRDTPLSPQSLRDSETVGSFILTKSSGLNPWKFPIANETAVSGISRKEDNLARCTPVPNFSKIPCRNFLFHIFLLSKFLGFSVEWFAFRKFGNSRTFLKLFQEISVSFAPVLIVSEFWVEWKAPCISSGYDEEVLRATWWQSLYPGGHSSTFRGFTREPQCTPPTLTTL